eukprot:TRINITY_DN4335_c0_g1_i3.p1 TRINITY_DN4335_c0_g1~~TRINITY_DN4335_c0_g1_i3.p1  ORF type:complete len:621 (+),score=151.79 TRINITY_DN4335_c0_g1_i3:45-1907(+)
MAQESIPNSIDRFFANRDNSWVKNLLPDPQTKQFEPNKKSREVKAGHYVFVTPTPLPDPFLICHSPVLSSELELSDEDILSDPRFTAYFSGRVDVIPGSQSWATPYALAIYGQDYYTNCPFRTGNGYGDGRAISVGEVVIPKTGKRWELQLKGGGTTPFCRSADGRAVLRSSVREFLASEAMFHLGVSTTRALSLIASGVELVSRPWYSGKSSYPEPDIMVNDLAAITCRVSPSFLRVGHVQLFERRVRNCQKEEEKESKLNELRLIFEHVLYREFPEINLRFKNDDGLGPLQPRLLAMLEEAGVGIARLMADWLRVGYCQGNFNSDNCLVGGRTMDYGPFGFLEKFQPLWCMWIGGGEHFGFMNQPTAGLRNFMSLVKATLPLLDSQGVERAKEIFKNQGSLINEVVGEMWRKKLGLHPLQPSPLYDGWKEETEELFNDLLALMKEGNVDYTIFWRQLSFLLELCLGTTIGTDSATAATASTDTTTKLDNLGDEIFVILKKSFYETSLFTTAFKLRWENWIVRWMNLLNRCHPSGTSTRAIASFMRTVSPKYVPREWMLVAAYEAASRGNFSVVKELYQLFLHPYEEQVEFEHKYYVKASHGCRAGGGGGQVAGVSFMS